MRICCVTWVAFLCFPGSFARADLPQVEQCVVLLAAENTDGTFNVSTGFFVSSDGFVATADHNAVNPDDGKPRKLWARAAIHGGGYSAYPLKLLKRFGSGLDSGRDIAILRVEGKHAQPFHFLQVGKEPVLGAEVFMVGFPILASEPLESPFARRGIVSSTKYEHFGVPSFILDVPMVHGHSGSPIVDKESGEVMGVACGWFTEHATADFTFANRITREDIHSARQNEDAEGKPKATAALADRPGKALSGFFGLNQSE